MDNSKGHKPSDSAKATIVFAIVITIILILAAIPYFVNVLNKRTPEPAVEVDIPNSGQIEPPADEANASASASEAESTVTEEPPAVEAATSEESRATSEATYYYAPAPSTPSAESTSPAPKPVDTPTSAPESHSTAVDNPGVNDDGYTSDGIDSPGATDQMRTECSEN